VHHPDGRITNGSTTGGTSRPPCRNHISDDQEPNRLHIALCAHQCRLPHDRRKRRAAGIARRAPYTRIFRDSVLLAELPDLVAEEMKGKTASVTDKAQKQVASAIENARDYAQAVIDTLMKARAA
jgi:hypothetical protein